MTLRRDVKTGLLAGVPLFSGCSRKELRQISSLADELFQPEGTTLIAEGTKGREFFVLVDGTVEIRRDGRSLRGLEAGDFFGEIALVADVARTATVVTTSRVRLLVITGQSFRRLLHEAPAIQAKVLQALAERLPPTAA